jgi:hypothetical protein
MPSDLIRPTLARPGSRWAWLWSQGLGVVCGQATVLLLALGSVLLAATRDGASASIAMDDLRGFFVEPSVAHAWLYLLLPVLGLYGLNTLLATWRNVVAKWRNGTRMPRAYAAPVIHVAFLIGLLAHLVGGLWSHEARPLLVGPGWLDLEDGREARVTALRIEHLPDGGVKQVWATLEVREAGGHVSEATVSYNGPLSSGLGSDLLLLARPTSVPGAARLAKGPAGRCRVEVDAACDLGGMQARLLYLQPPGRRSGGALARVRVRASPHSPADELWLAQGRPQSLPDGTWLTLEGIESRPAILLRRRHAPGNPWALLASLVLVLGLGMMWRRFASIPGR